MQNEWSYSARSGAVTAGNLAKSQKYSAQAAVSRPRLSEEGPLAMLQRHVERRHPAECPRAKLGSAG